MAPKTPQAIFTMQYRDKSGPGSTKEASAPYCAFVSEFIKQTDARSFVDIGCGDGTVISQIDWWAAARPWGTPEEFNPNPADIKYVGYDIIAERANRNREMFRAQVHVGCFLFEHIDVRELEIPPCDILLCKDVLQHWPTEDVVRFLAKLKTAPIKHALITNDARGENVNGDIKIGEWRPLDLHHWGPVVFSYGDKDVVLIHPR